MLHVKQKRTWPKNLGGKIKMTRFFIPRREKGEGKISFCVY